MSTSRNAIAKPLSFSTTMRNPYRIASFINCLLPFENKILTNDIIMKIVVNVIKNKLYKPYYISKNNQLKIIYEDEENEFTDSQILDIVKNSDQDHKEAGFDRGWPSRFDTWFKLPMEFGYIYYKMNEPIKISNVGHMLIDAYNELPTNEEKIQNVLLNSMIKYRSDNPFRKNSNSNVPLILLLQVIKLLKDDQEENDAGIYRQELSLFICWKDNNANELYKKIKAIRKEKKYSYSDEYIYDICLEILGVGPEKKNRFKLSQITGEAIDEYIRKMRSTGIISLRGNGRFVDFNMLEIEKIRYILSNYAEYRNEFDSQLEYFEYMGKIDSIILNIKKSINIDENKIRKDTLENYATKYSSKEIFNELLIVCNKRESRNPIFKIIPGPVRLEFLTSIALVQQFKNIEVNPNYIIDDEGLPIRTALGGSADIVCYDMDYNSLVEVSLMCGRQDQVNNEIIPIKRHLLEAIKENPNSFSVFIAPKIHEDTKDIAEWFKHRDNVNILTYDINSFIENISIKKRLSELLTA